MAPTEKKQALFISVAGFKGGIGKTSVALNIAALLALRGFKVGFFEHDKQSSLEVLMGMEDANFPFELLEDINEIPEGTDFVIADWPPGVEGYLFEGQQDILVILLQPSLLDWNATQTGLNSLSKDTKHIVVVNRLKKNSQDHQEILEGVRDEYPDEEIPTIYERTAMQAATNRSTTVFGLENRRSGVREVRTDIEEVVNAIFVKLGMELPV